MASPSKRLFAPSFRMRLLLLQALVVASTMVVAGLLVNQMQERQFREAYRDRMIAVAQSIATLPTILDAYDSADPSATIQPIAEVVREASNVTYIVVTDDEGIRHSHPNPERIGERVSTDPSVPLSGEMYVGTQTGTLGESWRVKLPIYDDDDPSAVIGAVSVGILEADLRRPRGRAQRHDAEPARRRHDRHPRLHLARLLPAAQDVQARAGGDRDPARDA